MSVEDVKTCEPTLAAIETLVLRTACSPAEAVAGTLLFLNMRQSTKGDALQVIEETGDMKKEPSK